MDPSILLLLVTVGLLVMLMMSRRRQQREQQSMQSKLAPGSEVMTASGMYATVISVEDTVVVLESGPGQQSRWDRRAIGRVLSAPADDLADDDFADDGVADDGVADHVRDVGDDTGRSKES